VSETEWSFSEANSSSLNFPVIGPTIER
jgi:hypothetical protein